MFFLFGNSLQNAQNILISFPSSRSHLHLSFHASWYLHVFLIKAGVSDPLLISLWYDDCFPHIFLQRKSTVSLALASISTYWLMFYFTKGKYIRTLETKSCHLLSHSAFCFTWNPDFHSARECLGLFACLFLKCLPLAILCLFQGFSTFWYDTKNNKKEHVHYVFLREW